MAKILLVEDDSNLREIYGARLEAEGYEIVAASDGEEALALAVRERPDLIISDVMMPKISGFDMLDILRTTPETKNVKVIVMTALSQDEDRRRGEELGADRYVVKSQVTLDDVVTMVQDLLSDGPVAPQQNQTDTSGTIPSSNQPKLDPASTAISQNDQVNLDQEVQQFVATSPLMGASQAPQAPVQQDQSIDPDPQQQTPTNPTNQV